MKKKAIALMMVTVIAKCIGFLREIVLSYYFGASTVTDAFMISLTIPGTLFTFLGTGLLTSYIPIYNQIEKLENKEYEYQFTSNLINNLIFISIILILVVFYFTEDIVILFASGFDKETVDIAVIFTRIGIVSIIFSSLIYVFSGYLQMKDRIVYVAFSGIPSSIVVLLSIIFSSYYGIVYLAIGNTLSILIQFLFLIPMIYFSGFRFYWKFSFKDIYIKRMIKLSLPVIIGISINQINVLVDRTIASRISIGGITSIMYANKINMFIQSVFVMSIATIFFIEIAEFASSKEFERLKVYLIKSVNVIGLLVIPASFILVFFSNEIVEFLFDRGAFSENAKIMTSSSLMFYSFGMIGFGLRDIFSRVYYSLQDTKTPTINAAVGMFLNIILNIILSRFLGVGGLALATSISGIVTTFLLARNLKIKIGEYGKYKITSTYIKIINVSIVMTIFSKLIFIILGNYFDFHLQLVMSLIAGGIIYLIGVNLTNIDEVSIIMQRFKLKKFITRRNYNE